MMRLTISLIKTLSDASVWKCGKWGHLPNVFFNNYNTSLYRNVPYLFGFILKDFCCRFVEYVKGLKLGL